MFLTLAASLALIQGGAYRTDTTVAVREGTRLAIEAMGGDVVIRTWDRAQVRIRADHSSSTSIGIRNDGAVLRLEGRGRMGMPGRTDFELTVPAWMHAELDGMNFSLDVDGVAGVRASTLSGDLVARNAQDIEFNTMSGDVRVERARGRLSLGTVAGQIEVTDATGTVEVSAVSGNIGLYRIESSRVEAGSISGQVIYQGAIRPEGSYTFNSHSGNVTLAIPEGADATLRTSTMSGNMSASFTLPALDQMSRGRTVIRFGTGRAVVDVESFSGSVRLVRPSEAPPMPARSRRGERAERDVRWRDHGDYLDGLDDLEESLEDLFDDSDLRGLARLGSLQGLISHSLHAGLSGLSRMRVDVAVLPVPPVPPASTTFRWEW